MKFTAEDIFYAMDNPKLLAQSLSKLATVEIVSGKVANVVGTNQVETATVVGTITASGNASVVVTASGMTGTPKTITVAVLDGDTASEVATKIRTALAADTAVSAMFTVGGTGAGVALTKKAKAANDATLNIALDNGTCEGLTTAATSANTTAGVATVDGIVALSNTPINVLAVLAVVSASGAMATKALLDVTTDYTVSGSNLLMATDQHLNKLIVIYTL